MSGETGSRSWRRLVNRRNVAILLGFFVLSVLAHVVYVAVFYQGDRQDLLLLGQTEWHADSPGSLRLVVSDRVSGMPIQGARVRLSLTGGPGDSDRPIELGAFRTDEHGTLAESFRIPEVEADAEYRLRVDVRSSAGRDRIERQVAVKRPLRVYLTSDKPIYQPGQTIHLRTMALHSVTLKPYAETPVVFEVADPKGNVVFRESVSTSRFGIASADFNLADEVNLGRYRARVKALGSETERVVTVKRYVLPRFKAEISTDKEYYLPGEEMRGRVEARYFFGKPVAGAEAVVELYAEPHPQPVKRISGRTDGEGVFSFSYPLPDFFAGAPLSGRDGVLGIEVSVTDTAGHTQATSAERRVSENPIQVRVIPEGGPPIPGVDNVFYIVASYPDGRPAQCRLTVNEHEVRTDATGLATLEARPEALGARLAITARDDEGIEVSVERLLSVEDTAPPFLLRTDKAVYDGGDTMLVSVLSTVRRDTCYLDIIKDGQTVLTKTVPVRDGRGELAMDLPPGLFGALQLNAYGYSRQGETHADRRVILVRQASELDVKVSADKPVYRPGETAALQFEVRDRQGRPTPAALGVAAVDEAVFHVSENRPGLMKQFFLVGQEILAPSYQTELFATPAALLQAPVEDQRLAKAALADAMRPPVADAELARLKGEHISERAIEHLRRMRDRGELDYFREDERYREAIRLVEGSGDYTLKARTGPAKEAAENVYRRRYFERLRGLVLLLPLTVVPIALLVSFLTSAFRLCDWPSRGVSEDPAQSLAVRATHFAFYSTRLIIALPFVTWMAALIAIGTFFHNHPQGLAIFVLLFNAALVLVVCVYQLANALALGSYPGARRLVWMLVAAPLLFLMQHFVTRAAILHAIYAPTDSSGIIVFLSVAASLIAALSAATLVSAGVERVSDAFGFNPPETRSHWVKITVYSFVVILLYGVFMPALARAREEARRASAMSTLGQVETARMISEAERPRANGDDAPRLRKDFPETLLWRPQVITDDDGRATLAAPLADSITAWRLSVDAVSAEGQLGGAESGVRVFQDFFVDIDTPLYLTQNDEVSLPVACYNYLDAPQRVAIRLDAGDGFAPAGPVEQVVELAPDEVRAVHFRVKAVGVGELPLEVVARGDTMSDAVRRTIRVKPDGSKAEVVLSGNLSEAAEHAFVIPPEAIEDSEGLHLNLHGSRFSEVVEGMENVLRKPFGCFEQTLSCAYPNVLALLYMERMAKAPPEVQVRAREFVNAGYQRLLTFEVPGGGFDWYGTSPAKVILSAYAVLALSDMAKVHPIDAAVMDRTRARLYARQRWDGSWTPVRTMHHTWGQVAGPTVTTAYVAWALAESGQRGRELNRALDYLREHVHPDQGAYTLALAANALLEANPRDGTGRRFLASLRRGFTVEGDMAWLSDDTGMGATYSRGASLNVETTALAALAMAKANEDPQMLARALNWIARQKRADGAWASTQSTILAIKALLAGGEPALPAGRRSEVRVTVNGVDAGTLLVTAENSDVLQMLSLREFLRPGRNVVRMTQDEPVSLAYQLVGSYWRAWEHTPAAVERTLDIRVEYDRNRLGVDETMTCDVVVENRSGADLPMAIVDLGIPPGFEVIREGLEAALRDGRIARYDITGNQVIVYTRFLPATRPLELRYALRARYPVRAKTPPSQVYEYYDPDNRAIAQPQEVIVEEAD